MKEATLVALFDEYEDAKGALDDLLAAGIARDKIQLLANGASSHHPGVLSNPAYAREDMVKMPEADATSALGLGVVVGSIVFGIGGRLISASWVAVAFGAFLGAIIGGVIGWMMDRGPSEEDEKLYDAGIRHSGTLITVHLADDLIDRVIYVFKARGAVDIEKRDADWRASGWVSFDPDAVTSRALGKIA